jgi:hypothetical protein
VVAERGAGGRRRGRRRGDRRRAFGRRRRALTRSRQRSGRRQMWRARQARRTCAPSATSRSSSRSIRSSASSTRSATRFLALIDRLLKPHHARRSVGLHHALHDGDRRGRIYLPFDWDAARSDHEQATSRSATKPCTSGSSRRYGIVLHELPLPLARSSRSARVRARPDRVGGVRGDTSAPSPRS